MSFYGKYFTYKDQAGMYHCHELIRYEQIANMQAALKNSKVECHATMQDYTKDGDVIGGWMYFDVDSVDLDTAIQKTRAFINWIEFMYTGIEYRLWFSGNRGFHIMLPNYIKHSRWHEVMGEYCSQHNLRESFDIDTQIYRRKGMLRMERSLNLKSGIKKTAIESWCLDKMTSEELIEFCGQRDGAAFEGSVPTSDELTADVESIITIVNARPVKEEQTRRLPTEIQPLLPCLKAIWEQEDYPMGERHHYTYILARAFRNAGYEEDDVYYMFEQHPFFGGYSSREWSKVIGSVYRSGRSGLGCRYGRDADTLKQYCDEFCHLNEDLADTILGEL